MRSACLLSYSSGRLLGIGSRRDQVDEADHGKN